MAILVSTPALAVDLVNRDRVDREAVVNTNDGQSNVLTLKAGERVANVCTSCVILVGDTSVEVAGRDVAVIQGGKVTAGR
ncbi:MAG: hypothetical protein K1X51_07675 [Rhodospirillaceae bacterium]|nr:hypothetical protein [Rhodospirillaceae bacterium]